MFPPLYRCKQWVSILYVMVGIVCEDVIFPYIYIFFLVYIITLMWSFLYIRLSWSLLHYFFYYIIQNLFVPSDTLSIYKWFQRTQNVRSVICFVLSNCIIDTCYIIIYIFTPTLTWSFFICTTVLIFIVVFFSSQCHL